MPNGTYTIVLAYNTHSDLGILSSKRLVKIEFSFYEAQQRIYEAAKKANDSAGMAKASLDLLARSTNRRVGSGQVFRLETAHQGSKQEARKLSAAVQWYPQAEDIRVEVSVVDANFGVNPKTLNQGSSVCLFFAPNGFDDTRTRLNIAPSGAADAPIVQGPGAESVKATWRRTPDGYRIVATVPYASLKGYRKGWTLMPVDAMVNSKTPEGRCALVGDATGQPGPGQTTRYYLKLVK